MSQLASLSKGTSLREKTVIQNLGMHWSHRIWGFGRREEEGSFRLLLVKQERPPPLKLLPVSETLILQGPKTPSVKGEPRSLATLSRKKLQPLVLQEIYERF